MGQPSSNFCIVAGMKGGTKCGGEAGESPARRGGGEGEGKKEDGRVSRFVFTRGENPSLSLSPFAIVVGGG